MLEDPGACCSGGHREKCPAEQLSSPSKEELLCPVPHPGTLVGIFVLKLPSSERDRIAASTMTCSEVKKRSWQYCL